MTDPAPFPRRADAVVIGGGVVGVSAALLLAERGLTVVLCEKGRVAGEQSSRNWGWIRKTGRDPRELPLMIEASALWERFAAETGEETGHARRGVTYLCGDAAELARREVWLEAVRPFQLDSRMLSARETAALLNRDESPFAGALHTPSDATAEPACAVPALARRARALGVAIHEGCAIRALLREAGAVRGVVAERGTIRADRVILAGGVWTRALLENEGLRFPQLAVTASVLRTTSAPTIAPGGLGATDAAIRRRGDGGYTVARVGAARFDLTPAAFRYLPDFLRSAMAEARTLKFRLGPAFVGPMGRRRWTAEAASPFERWRVLDPAPDRALLREVFDSAKRLHPQLAGAGIAETWGGMIDVTPDELPVIDAVPGVPGLVVASGFSGHGFGLGPGGALLAAQIATGEAPAVDPTPFRWARLAA